MTSLELPFELREGLRKVKERDGVPVSEQIRRAVRMWLDQKGIKTTPSKKLQMAKKRRAAE
jgi:Arc/MetJ-type ribon-helix-helix transcriptional regulator